MPELTNHTFEVVVSAPSDMSAGEAAKQLEAVTQLEGVRLDGVMAVYEVSDNRHISPEVRSALVLMRSRGCSLYRVPSKQETTVRERMNGIAVVTLHDASYLLMVNLGLISFTAQDIDLDRYDLSERGREVAHELERALIHPHRALIHPQGV